MDAKKIDTTKLTMRYPDSGEGPRTMHECPRCAGNGVNRTSRHLDQNGNDSASDFNFVPCWLCAGLGWLHPCHHSTNVAAAEALRLEEELAGAYPSRFKPRPPKKSPPFVVVQTPDAILKARLV